MRHALLAAVLVLPAPALAADATPPIAAEVEKGVKAYNAQDIAYYEDALATDAVYIAEDGAVFAGKERVLRLFTRIFAKKPARQLTVSDLATGTRGDVAWARFKWTLAMGPDSREGVSSILFARAGDAWQVLQIQNTPAGHVMAASPPPSASPSASPSAPPKP
jgi:ketosteroid isomerase-like protein